MDGYCDILEFKLPYLKGKAVIGTPERPHPTYDIDSAIAQVNIYKEWCDQDVNVEWLEKKHGIRIKNPRKTIVMGHSSEFTAEDRRKISSDRNANIKTYDEFIDMARYLLYNAAR